MSTLRQYSVGFSSLIGGLFTKANFKALFVLWLPVFLLSAFIGLCCVVLPWQLCAALAAAVAYVSLLWIWPWVGFGAYVFIALMAPDFKLADVATVASMAVYIFSLWTRRQSAPPLPAKLRSVSLWFAAIVVLSFALAIFHFHNKIPNIYRDGRVFLYWLWLPILWRMSASEAGGVQKLVRVIVAIAYIVVLLAVFQWLTGVQVVAVGLVASLGATSGFNEEVTRVQMPGFLFVTWAIIWLTLQVLFKRVNLLIGGGLILALLLGLYVNFGRGLWTWTFIGVMLPLFFIGGSRAAKLLATVLVAGVLGVGTLAVVKPSVLENISERLLSVKNEGGKRSSYGWRQLENHEAVLTLQRSPLVGVAMGGEYRPWLHELRLFFEHVRYLHNSYLFIAVKLGIPGLLCLLFFCWRAWNGARKGLPEAAQEQRVTLLTCLAFFPAAMGLSITQPEFMNTYSVLLFVIVIVLCANFFASGARLAKPVRQRGAL
jgi:O-antigen ligase